MTMHLWGDARLHYVLFMFDCVYTAPPKPSELEHSKKALGESSFGEYPLGQNLWGLPLWGRTHGGRAQVPK